MGSAQRVNIKKVKKKSAVQVWLESIELIDEKIESKLIEKQQWHDLALSITAAMDGERVQSSGAKDKMGSAVDRCIDAEAEIDSQVALLVREKKKVTETLERLDNPFYYKILHMRYIRYIPFNKIAEQLHKEYTTITTAHGRALKHVQKLRK